MPKLIVFGDLCVDIVAVPRSIPEPGGDATLKHLTLVCGGAAHNCAIAAARCGASVEVIGLVGDDEFGRMILSSLRAHSVGTAHIQSRREACTGTVLAMVSPNGERTLYSYRGANAERYGMMPTGLLQGQDYVYLSGYSLQEPASKETADQLKALARACGAIVLLDPSFQSAATLAASGFLEGLDWITPNETEAALITDHTGVTNVAVTLGAEGCLINGTRVPAESTNSVAHTTGAGDAFCGGLLAALLDGCTPVEAAHRANRAAAAAITHNGSR